MASGSHVCSGSCADFPRAPPSRSAAAATAGPDGPHLSGALHQRLDLQRAQARRQQEQPEGHGRVPDARHDEGLLSRGAVGWIGVPEPDEQVAAEAHPLPPQVKEQQIIGQHEREHGGHEEVHVGKEAAVALLVAHELRGIDVDQQAHDRHHQRHEQRQPVQVQPDPRLEARDGHPPP
jgi:hypothetical protein